MNRYGTERAKGLAVICLLAGLLVVFCANARASGIKLWKGQTVYVPIYSYIYYGNKSRKMSLTATLSIRNADLSHTITLTAVDYFDSRGRLIRKFLEKPVELGPLATDCYVVAESDINDGLGTSFIIKWKSGRKVTSPVIEGVMIGAFASQGISLTSRGTVISESAE